MTPRRLPRSSALWSESWGRARRERPTWAALQPVPRLPTPSAPRWREPLMLLGDLRGWLTEVERRGELRVIRGADWRLEIGAASELNLHGEQQAALLFDQIADYPPGYRVLTCSNASPSRLG